LFSASFLTQSCPSAISTTFSNNHFELNSNDLNDQVCSSFGSPVSDTNEPVSLFISPVQTHVVLSKVANLLFTSAIFDFNLSISLSQSFFLVSNLLFRFFIL
jgi:hypothetical protein